MGSEVERSAVRITSDGTAVRFSNREDVEKFIVSEVAKSAVDGSSVEATDLWVTGFLSWLAQGGTGCRFAQHRAHRASEAQVVNLLLPPKLTPEIVEVLQEVLSAADDAQAVQMIFPGVSDLTAMADVLRALTSSTHWTWSEVEGDEDPNSILVAIRWKLERSRYLSELLAFGPFDGTPVTRQSPVAVLTLRTHPPQQVESDGRVHLAQMPLFQIEEQHRDYFWTQSREQKLALLNGELEFAARARITIRLPRSLWP